MRTIALFASVCIEAPAEVVWARLARLEDIRLWSEAVLDGVAMGLRDGLDVIVAAGSRVDSFTVVGGGSRSAYWGKLIAGALSRGVGAERTCDLRGGITIRERWLAWDEGRSFTYEGVGIPLLASARNEWGVQPEGDLALLTSRAEVVLRGGPLGRLLEPVVAYQLKRVGPRTLAAFKYLVEHGEPPKVRHAKLPRVATAC